MEYGEKVFGDSTKAFSRGGMDRRFSPVSFVLHTIPRVVACECVVVS
jgi:hypothetical protein